MIPALLGHGLDLAPPSEKRNLRKRWLVEFDKRPDRVNLAVKSCRFEQSTHATLGCIEVF